MATCPKCRAQFSDDVQHCPSDGETLLPDAACVNFDQDLQAGAIVGEYEIEEKIGEGGFGKVYRATHPVIGKRAAIKVLNREYSSNPAVVSRFVSEARAVNQIRQRNIIDIFSFGGLDDGRQYLVMELLDGLTMDAYLEQHGRMTPVEALPVLRQMGRALDAAHAAGIAHRDLKPENVFLCFDDEGTCYPKLLDFGIAKLLADKSVSHKTRTGAAMGTPLYMSPEQCRGKGVDHRTDIYSFGVMVHEALTGNLPFDGDSMMDLMFKHAKEPPPRMSEMNADIPAQMDGPVLQMLHKDPAMRPKSVSAAVEALADAARTAGFDVPFKKNTTSGDNSVPGLAEKSGMARSFAEAATMHADTTAGESGGGARTFNSVETSVAEPNAGSAKTIIIAAAALVIGVGITFAVTSGGDRADGDKTQGAASAPVDHGDAIEKETAIPEPSASAMTAKSAEPTATTAETDPVDEVADAEREKTTTGKSTTGKTTTGKTTSGKSGQPTASVTAVKPPPAPPPPPPPRDVPKDLASPFD